MPHRRKDPTTGCPWLEAFLFKASPVKSFPLRAGLTRHLGEREQCKSLFRFSQGTPRCSQQLSGWKRTEFQKYINFTCKQWLSHRDNRCVGISELTFQSTFYREAVKLVAKNIPFIHKVNAHRKLKVFSLQS